MNTSDKLSRRVFAMHVAAMAAGAMFGVGCGLAATGRRAQTKQPKVWIAGLVLRTARPIAEMKDFYAEKLGFELTDEASDSFSFRSGESEVEFRQDENAAQDTPDASPRYHFAFNIPHDRVLAAHAWQKERTELIVPPERLVDEGMPREVVAFRHWNAHSVFFRDPAGNVVEYIARHDLDNAAEDNANGDNATAFSAKNCLCVSEIGLVVDDVPAVATSLKQSLSVDTYVSASETFEPLGDQNGLLLIMKRGQPMAFGTGGKRDVFATEVKLKQDMESVEFGEYPFHINGSSPRSSGNQPSSA